MNLISLNSIKSFGNLNKQLWKYCWKYWYAKEYTHNGIKEYLRTEIVAFKKLHKEVNILDVGCGSGWVAKYFADLLDTYMGIDFNADLIQQLNKDFSKKVKCSFSQYDIQSKDPVTFSSGNYNLILANFILLELSDLKCFFENMASMQSKGDSLIITGLDSVNEILRISSSDVNLDENLRTYRQSHSPLVIRKGMSFDGEDTDFEYLRILYSIKDILSSAFANSYKLIEFDDKLNLSSNSPKSPLYYAIKLKRI